MPNAEPLVVCGVDPGLRTTGYAVLACGAGGVRVLDAGACRFRDGTPLASLLASMDADFSEVLEEFRPNLVAVEALYTHYRHPRTAVLMAHARGVILAAAGRRGIRVHNYGATRVKRYLTGNGRATKHQMQWAVQRTLGLAEPPEPHDVADALAVALCCAGDVGHATLREAAP